jgi:drug/metabolite transporter (DMT)-like permease
MAIAGAIAFSGKAIIVKLAYRYGVDAVTLIMYRMLFALPLFLAMAWWTSRPRDGVKPVALTAHDKFAILGLGFCGYYLASFLDFAGLQYISASLERLILYLNPTLVVILGWALLKKRISQQQATGMALSYAGVLIVFGHEARLDGRDVTLGAVLVFGSALSYAFYLLYSGEYVKRLGSLRLVGLATSVACVLCILQFVLLKPLSAAAVAPEVIWLSVANAVLCTALPVVLVMMAIEKIGSGLAAQAGMVGPISTVLLGVIVLDEPLTAWILMGTLVVLLGVAWVSKVPKAG